MIMRRASVSKFLIRLLLVLNFGLVLSLLLAYLAPYLSPAIFWPVAFFGLGFPVIVGANLAISVFWLFLKPRCALISLLAVLSGINPVSRQWQWNNNSGQRIQKSITVVSFNVHDFSGLLDGSQKVSTRKEIFKFLHDTKPQIVCLQDMPFYFPDRNLILPALASDLKMKHFFPLAGEHRNKHRSSGTSLLTSFPVVASGEVSDRGISFAIYADMVIKQDTVRVYSIHLASTKLYGGKELLTTQGIAESGKRGIPRRIFGIILRLKSAFIKRASQSDILSNSIGRSPYPVIVCGDFNDTPLSYALHTIRHGLKDSFVSCGNGFGRTYGEATFPLRIDYVLASPGFDFKDHQTSYTRLSDHLPVVARINYRNEEIGK